MTTPRVYYVKIDETGQVGRTTNVPPQPTGDSQPRVTTINIFNWSSKEHRLRLVFDPKTDPRADEQYVIIPA